MGRDCGFEAFKLVDGKFEKANVFDDQFYEDGKSNYLNICGRCEATDIFLRSVIENNPHIYLSDDELSEDDKFLPVLLLNQPKLDQQIIECEDWPMKLFYIEFSEFKKKFDFDKAEKEHQKRLNYIQESIDSYDQEIKDLRELQVRAQTSAAFDGFQKTIDLIKEKLESEKEDFKDEEEDDYDYNHYRWIKEMFEEVENVMKQDPEIIITAYASE